VSYAGRPAAPLSRPALDPNFAVAIDESYWKERAGVATLSWTPGPLTRDPRLEDLVPQRSVLFRGPIAAVSEPADPAEVAVRLAPEGSAKPPLPAIVVRRFGKGRVVYLAAGLDAALWSYSFPYQRRL